MAPRLFFITGKGGVGKTTVAAALARGYGGRRRRVLMVETGTDASLARLFDAETFSTEPAAVGGGLHGVRIDQRALLESYFRRLLRLPFLSRRLFASPTFNAVTAAAPGVNEFVILEQLAHWTEPGRFGGRAAYDTVIVDGPATGHALRLLRTPRQLARLVPRGPLAGAVARLQALLDDARRTAIVLVTIPDDMAVAETLEARVTLADQLGLRLTAPVLNRVWPHRFSAAEAQQIAALSVRSDEPVLAAARLAIGARRDADRHGARLRRAFGRAPVSLNEACAEPVGGEVLERFGQIVAKGLGDDD